MLVLPGGVIHAACAWHRALLQEQSLFHGLAVTVGSSMVSEVLLGVLTAKNGGVTDKRMISGERIVQDKDALVVCWPLPMPTGVRNTSSKA